MMYDPHLIKSHKFRLHLVKVYTAPVQYTGDDFATIVAMGIAYSFLYTDMGRRLFWNP